MPDTYASSDILRHHPIFTVTILMCLSHLNGVGQTLQALHTQLEMDTHMFLSVYMQRLAICLTHTHVHTLKASGSPRFPGFSWAQTGFWGPLALEYCAEEALLI